MKNKNLTHLFFSVTGGTAVIYLLPKAESWFWGIGKGMSDDGFREIEEFAVSDIFVVGFFVSAY